MERAYAQRVFRPSRAVWSALLATMGNHARPVDRATTTAAATIPSPAMAAAFVMKDTPPTVGARCVIKDGISTPRRCHVSARRSISGLTVYHARFVPLMAIATPAKTAMVAAFATSDGPTPTTAWAVWTDILERLVCPVENVARDAVKTVSAALANAIVIMDGAARVIATIARTDSLARRVNRALAIVATATAQVD